MRRASAAPPMRALAIAAALAAALTSSLLGSGCRVRKAGEDAAASGSGAGAGSAAGSAAAAAAQSTTVPVMPLAAATGGEPRLAYGAGSFVEVVGAARLAVVTLRAKAPVKSGPAAMLPGAPDAVADVALGTGFLVEAKGPHVLTTDRIAAAASELLAVQVDGTELALKLVGRDPRLDVALLSVVTRDGAPLRLPALSLGDSDRLLVGEWLLVLGNPFGDEVTAAAGLVSATGREATAAMVAPSSGASYRTMLQTDARIHRGNSGGPVLDTAGQVIGIATATSERPTELSFVIPINRVKEILESLRDAGRVERAWLGAMVKPVTAEQAKGLGMEKATGALITQLIPGSPAAKSALRTGDVVLRWNDRDVDHRSMPWAVAATPPGKPVRVVVWRGKASLELSVTVEPMPQ
jgi:serine protease Do